MGGIMPVLEVLSRGHLFIAASNFFIVPVLLGNCFKS